jgi:hypothetical protein
VVDRRLLTFFASPKKCKPKKATSQPLPFGFPLVQVKKWEAPTTRYAQTRALLFPFSAMHNRQRQKRNSKSTAKPRLLLIRCFVKFFLALCVKRNYAIESMLIQIFAGEFSFDYVILIEPTRCGKINMTTYKKWLLRSRMFLFTGAGLVLGPTLDGFEFDFSSPIKVIFHLLGLPILLIGLLDCLGFLGSDSVKLAINEENIRIRAGKSK